MNDSIERLERLEKLDKRMYTLNSNLSALLHIQKVKNLKEAEGYLSKINQEIGGWIKEIREIQSQEKKVGTALGELLETRSKGGEDNNKVMPLDTDTHSDTIKALESLKHSVDERIDRVIYHLVKKSKVNSPHIGELALSTERSGAKSGSRNGDTKGCKRMYCLVQGCKKVDDHMIPYCLEHKRVPHAICGENGLCWECRNKIKIPTKVEKIIPYGYVDVPDIKKRNKTNKETKQ